MGASVELHPLGFVVTLDDGTYMPKMLPDRVMVFSGRHIARELAAAIDTDDMTTAHALIAEHGRVYVVGTEAMDASLTTDVVRASMLYPSVDA